ncbi:MAG: arginine--tRNA ligase [Candidatus Nephthysia bennettiae]|uniref:Arginine--tRNA ligase n=1 Tax=Candidatus Nephthysia bennettiae TaxID=3127016 RepID=A0A934N8W2_9BACT|nr:arginine--tRNA ligase [Candidatus Dormibacteraeota bacterium]MBJ7613150.1 arginine--tRNA ligase [Candidatus Dormibacteraeota bacterium]PZR93778.1 MAG: arginine--tRNA ligase [Candidatus Dormibacteraeota bacterium]
MTEITSLNDQLDLRLRRAMEALPSRAEGVDPQLRRSDHADFQANGSFALARRTGANPRELAAAVVAACPPDEVVAACELSGPGFINLTLRDGAIVRQLSRRAGHPRLGVPAADTRVTLVEYSQPNIAKEMHVGHLRSTVIGDALARILAFLGAPVIRQNHLGDWGTQFGMLIQYLDEHPDADWHGSSAGVASLNRLYRSARELFDCDPGFADRARARVVRLQGGDPDTVGRWREIVAESMRYFRTIYEQLDVLLTDEDAVGESFYNPVLVEVAAELERKGVAVRSEGALCVFFDDVRGPDGQQVPLIVRKRDGGFGYAATDLAAIRHRTGQLGAERLLYVVDARQALHLRMVFETARRAGWVPPHTEVQHVAFGTVLGPDGKPFKTRAGDAVPLSALFEGAVEKARATISGRDGQHEPADTELLARQVGIGAVKYADLATSRTKDYVFDLDRMVSLSGNTGVYLQYAHARVRSILRRLAGEGEAPPLPDEVSLAPSERALALLLDDFSRVVLDVGQTLEPHRLCTYLYSLSQAFTDFYESCPVLRAETADQRAVRTLLCSLTADTLKRGLELLGIAAPSRL